MKLPSPKKIAAPAATLIFASLPFSAQADEQAAGGWDVKKDLKTRKLCIAVKSSSSVDMKVLRNKDNKMVLVATHSDWRLPFGQVSLTLAVDTDPPLDMGGMALGNNVLVSISDAALEQKVKNANTLKWHFSWGDFTADATGLGAAYDAIGTC